MMGQKAAEFASEGIYEDFMIPTALIIRESL
jgi:hypothetical protein